MFPSTLHRSVTALNGKRQKIEALPLSTAFNTPTAVRFVCLKWRSARVAWTVGRLSPVYTAPIWPPLIPRQPRTWRHAPCVATAFSALATREKRAPSARTLSSEAAMANRLSLCSTCWGVGRVSCCSRATKYGERVLGLVESFRVPTGPNVDVYSEGGPNINGNGAPMLPPGVPNKFVATCSPSPSVPAE